MVRTAALALLAAVALLLAPAAPLRAQGVERIAAVVNEDAISSSDVVSRLKLLLFSSGLQATQENQSRLLPQVLRSLIDETLQLQEVARFNIVVEEAEVEAAVADIARRNNLSPEQLRQLFARNDIPLSTLERQLEAGIGWQRLIRGRYGRNVDVSEQDIDDVIARYLANRDRPEYLVAEIFLPVDDPGGEAEIRQLADSLVRQIRGGAAFSAVAREFSRSAGAAQGGDLGWVIEGQLDPALDQAMAAMAPGEVSDPVRSLAGYHILLLRDRRRPGSTDPADQVVTLRRLLLTYPQGSAEGERAMAAARSASQEMKSCADLDARAAELGVAEAADAGTGALGRLPPAVQDLVADLPVGQPTAPQRFQGGVVVFMVCDRQLPGSTLPSRDAIRQDLADERLNLIQRRHLRDLRNAAFIDVRV
jgi:peptidyl-prolyl cis-trans isomerase SurA